jgi:hypothetical protein
MQPIEPFVVVDAALEGLGKAINVRPNVGSFGGVIMRLMMSFMPRQRFIKLGDDAVREMYDH